MNHTEQTVGATLGGLLGFINSIMIATALNWSVVLDTAILASVGALAGYLVTTLLKYLTKRITSWKSTLKKN